MGIDCYLVHWFGYKIFVKYVLSNLGTEKIYDK